MLPTIDFAGTAISRLIIGGNPFSGNSHVSPETDGEMMDYFTAENVKKALFRCTENGINTAQMRGDKHILRILREFRQEGGKINFIAQTASEIDLGGVYEIIKYDPIAIYHHGSMTDWYFKNGQIGEIEKMLEYMRTTGKWVGLGTHMPEVVEYAEAHAWDIDFYMACLYNISRVERVSSALTGKANEGEPFFDEDRALMYEAIRSTRKPCLAFKVLGATRRCGTPESVKAAFAEAFANIKPSDAIVVGMFPKYRDQVAENAGFVREILEGSDS